MCVYDYIYLYKTSDGKTGVVRADGFIEATERLKDYYNNTNTLVSITQLSKIDNDYGVVEFVKENQKEDLIKSFIYDHEKMIDLFTISKKDFLRFYSYLTEEEYDATINEAVKRSGYWHQEWYDENKPYMDGRQLRNILFGIMVTEWLGGKTNGCI